MRDPRRGCYFACPKARRHPLMPGGIDRNVASSTREPSPLCARIVEYESLLIGTFVLQPYFCVLCTTNRQAACFEAKYSNRSQCCETCEHGKNRSAAAHPCIPSLHPGPNSPSRAKFAHGPQPAPARRAATQTGFVCIGTCFLVVMPKSRCKPPHPAFFFFRAAGFAVSLPKYNGGLRGSLATVV